MKDGDVFFFGWLLILLLSAIPAMRYLCGKEKGEPLGVALGIVAILTTPFVHAAALVKAIFKGTSGSGFLQFAKAILLLVIAATLWGIKNKLGF